MHRLFLIFLFLASCQPSKPKIGTDFKKDSSFIIGGTTAQTNEFPFLVNIWLRDPQTSFDDHLCGGSLISSNWVLTAAHCVTEEESESTLRKINPSKLTLIMKSPFRSGQGGIGLKAKSVVIHPHFAWPYHDVALIELANPVTDIQPLLLDPSDQNNSNSPAIVMGWGLMDIEGQAESKLLQKTILTLMDQKTCSQDEFPRKRSWEIGFDMLCAKTNGNRTAACAGDSGGPLVQWKSGRYYQIGIVSWGSACSGIRSLNSNVDGYASIHGAYDWIRSTVR